MLELPLNALGIYAMARLDFSHLQTPTVIHAVIVGFGVSFVIIIYDRVKSYYHGKRCA
jgi:preprotein translocase subunit SecF